MTSLPVFIARIYASNSFFFASSKDNMVSRPTSAGCRCMLSQTTVRSSQLHVAWCGWVLFRECRRTYFHSAFPLLVLKTKSGSRLVVIVVICLAVTKTGPYLHATFVSVLSKYQFLSAYIFFYVTLSQCFHPMSPFLISYTGSVLLNIPTGTIRLLTSVRCNFSLNQEDPATVSGKQKCQSHKQKSH